MAADPVAIAPDGRVIRADEDGLEIWDSDDRAGSPLLLEFSGGRITALAVGPDGRLISGHADGRMLVWDLSAPWAPPSELGRHPLLTALAVVPDGRVVSAGPGPLLVWDSGKPGADPEKLGPHESRITTLAGTPDGRVISGDDVGRALIWDPDIPGSGPVEIMGPGGPGLATLLAQPMRDWLILLARGTTKEVPPDVEYLLDWPYQLHASTVRPLTRDVAVRLLVVTAAAVQQWRSAEMHGSDPLDAAGRVAALLPQRLRAVQLPTEVQTAYEATLTHEFPWADTVTLESAAVWCALRDQVGGEDDDSLRDDGRFLLQLLGAAPTLID